MSMVELQHVDLIYPIREVSSITLKEFIVKGVFRKKKSVQKSIQALTDLSLRIQDGERVGFVGFNGAGKSTLLRTIAGVYPIAGGQRRVEGSICSLFDLSLGFEPESTGWENIFYRSYLQGETPKTVKPKLNDIAEFCELGDFLKVPLRCYSSGMTMRLAFAIATSSDPEILLIDEVFGTGDLAFQNKAEKRMKDFIHRANIVIMVGHHLEFLQTFCNRIIWLHHGRIRADGPAKDIIAAYTENAQQKRAA